MSEHDISSSESGLNPSETNVYTNKTEEVQLFGSQYNCRLK